MRIGPCTVLLAFAFAPVLLPQTASAQTAQAPARSSATPAATAQTAAPAATSAPACNCPASVVQQHFPPYTAKQTTTRVQTLADGTHITTVTTAQIWRDADGRMRTETTNTPTNGTPYRFISIYDPVARIRMSWTVGNPNNSKVVTVYHFPQPVAQPMPAAPQTTQRYYPSRNESLPPQTIEGLYATGFRNTNTTPAGYEGNDRDLTTTRETWTAQDLGITLRSIVDDPRTGKATTETADIQQIAPDPSLFKAPDGYQVKDTNP
ncbi:MAG: hypothetical protein ABSE27_02185 [Acidobacteriaceae bacterium]|jgi:hypothetical protein